MIPSLLDQILSVPNGAKFYWVDLHNHTPADPHFHCGRANINTAEARQEMARDYVRFVREVQGIDLLGLTDHNDVSWVGQVQAAAAELYPHELTIFPGVELGANEGKRQVHLLALFEPGTDPTHIDHFISSLGLLPHARFSDNQTPRVTHLNTRQLTQRITSREDGLPGLPIAAHATRKNGLLHELEGEGRVLAYEDPRLLALEIPSTREELSAFVRRLVAGEEAHYGHKAIACLNSSDGRGLHHVSDGRLPVGARPTRIKLSTISLAALRHALIDFDSRIRLPQGDRPRIVEAHYPRLLGLAVENGFLAGDATGQTPLLLHLNPNLNTLIGGRGAGKSSLLEAIRFVFDLPARSEEAENQQRRVISATLPTGAQVTAFYEVTADLRYQISRRPGQPPQVHDVATGQLLHIAPAHLLAERPPLEIYGQKEIFAIANNPHFQLELLDGYIAAPLREAQHAEAALVRHLQTNAQQLLTLQEELLEVEQRLTERPSIQLELARLEKDAWQEELTRKKELEEEKGMIQRLHQTAEQRLHSLGQFRRPPWHPLPAEAERFPAQVRALQEMEQITQRTLIQLQEQLTKLWGKATAEHDAWHAAYAAHEERYQALVRQYGPNLSMERYWQLQSKRQALDVLAHRQSELNSQLAALQADRANWLRELNQVRYEHIWGLRQAKAAALTAALNNTVRLTLTAAGHRQQFADYLRQLLDKRNLNKNVFQKLAESDLRPPELAAAIRMERTTAETSATPLANLGLTATYRQRLAAVPDELLYELELYAIPDLPDICLKVGEEYRSLTPPLGVAGLSVGQKCTAILSLILVEHETPLIIDQPEDDLDNAFIFREIVQTLRREKERRQFLIATHNANIPVSGDAELILLLAADEAHGWVAQRGSIDDPVLRGPVENILEGGRDAFRLRQAKYGLPN